MMPFRLSVHVYTPSAVLSAMDGPRVGKARFAENERNGQSGAVPSKGGRSSFLSRWFGFGVKDAPYPFVRSSVPISSRLRRRSCNFIFEKFSQPAFETHFCWRAPLRLQPSFKILNADLVPNLGLSDNN